MRNGLGSLPCVGAAVHPGLPVVDRERKQPPAARGAGRSARRTVAPCSSTRPRSTETKPLPRFAIVAEILTGRPSSLMGSESVFASSGMARLGGGGACAGAMLSISDGSESSAKSPRQPSRSPDRAAGRRAPSRRGESPGQPRTRARRCRSRPTARSPRASRSHTPGRDAERFSLTTASRGTANAVWSARASFSVAR